MMQKLSTLIFLVALAPAAWGGEAAPAAADPALEARMQALASELRCLVCQNQTLADSNAPLAVDLREEIREQMKRGATDAQITDYLVQRYGDFVLYRPPLKLTTLLLWLGPALLLIGGLTALYARLARRRREMPGAELSVEERTRAAAILAGDSDEEPR